MRADRYLPSGCDWAQTGMANYNEMLSIYRLPLFILGVF